MVRFLLVAVLVLLGNINQVRSQDVLARQASLDKKIGQVKEVNLKSNTENKGRVTQKGGSKQKGATKNKDT